jgi:hypothetical protein
MQLFLIIDNGRCFAPSEPVDQVNDGTIRIDIVDVDNAGISAHGRGKGKWRCAVSRGPFLVFKLEFTIASRSLQRDCVETKENDDENSCYERNSHLIYPGGGMRLHKCGYTYMYNYTYIYYTYADYKVLYRSDLKYIFVLLFHGRSN